MARVERMLFALAAALFTAFAVNVALGSFRIGEYVGDVSEMLLLFGASVFFVSAVLVRERRERVVEDSKRN